VCLTPRKRKKKNIEKTNIVVLNLVRQKLGILFEIHLVKKMKMLSIEG